MKTAKKNGAVGENSTSAGKKKNGRPTKFTKALGDEICQRMSEGQSLLKICKDEAMPSRETVYQWLMATEEVVVDGVSSFVPKYGDFPDKYEKAVALRADHMFDEIEEIADGSEEVVRKGAEKKSGAYANTQRLRVDTRKWYLSKIMPKKFSDKNVHVTEDENGKQMPITGNVIQFAPQANEPGS